MSQELHRWRRLTPHDKAVFQHYSLVRLSRHCIKNWHEKPRFPVSWLTTGLLPLLLAVSARLGVHFAPALALALHQLLQGKLRVGRRVAPQTGGAPRRVHTARLALLPGAHGAAPAARLAHDLRAGLGELRAQRLALGGAARAAEHHLGQRGAGEGRGEDQEAATRVHQHCCRRRREAFGHYHWGDGRQSQVGKKTRGGGGANVHANRWSRGLGGLLGPTNSQVCSLGATSWC